MSNELHLGIENAEVLNNSIERDDDGSATAACDRKLSRSVRISLKIDKATKLKKNNSWCRLIIEISFLTILGWDY